MGRITLSLRYIRNSTANTSRTLCLQKIQSWE